MPEPSNSLINLNLTEPATAFINRVSDAIGGLARPWQIERVAKAEAQAAITKATAEIEIGELGRRAVQRFVNEQVRQQQNMEQIAANAAPQITDAAKPNDVESDWISSFFQQCRNVSDAEMQKLWSAILAGEANAPGSYSRRTMVVLESLDKKDAEIFGNFCRFNWQMPVNVPVITGFTDIYTSHGVRFGDLTNLAAIGLLSLNEISGYALKLGRSEQWIRYQNEMFRLQAIGGEQAELPVGKVMLTNAGSELSLVIRGEPVPGFKEHVLGFWATHGWQVKETRSISDAHPLQPSVPTNDVAVPR